MEILPELNNEAIKRCRNNKKQLPILKEKLRLALEEEKKLIEQNKILMKEQERLEFMTSSKLYVCTFLYLEQ